MQTFLLGLDGTIAEVSDGAYKTQFEILPVLAKVQLLKVSLVIVGTVAGVCEVWRL